MIEIFPTSRAVREFYAAHLDTNGLLPKAMSIAQFLSNIVVVADKNLADEDTRLILLRQAADFKNFAALKIEREFLSFVKNATYLFGFFEELAIEKVTIAQLDREDTYAEFADHLAILSQLLANYKDLLTQKNLYDKITLVDLYSLQEDFIQNSGGFLYHLEGFLSRFELDLFCQIAEIVPFKISLQVSQYNSKMQTLFGSLGYELHVGFGYVIDLGAHSIESKKALKNPDCHYEVRKFSSRILQASFVYEQIKTFVDKGIAPQNIAVILPDEDFASTLKTFDAYKNCNFAMGESFMHNLLYKKLDALDKHLRMREEKEHFYRVKRLGIEQSIVDTFGANWSKKLSAKDIVALLGIFCDPQESQEIFQEELFRFTKLLERIGALQLQVALKLFLGRLAKQSSDDVMGGKVTVMGLLESRGVEFDGVIVVDFSDEFVPKRSQKDIFLTSALRSRAGLPSKKDRENLQRYFYSRLFSGAIEVAISHVSSEQSMASRFLDELGISESSQACEDSYSTALFEKNEPKARYDPDTRSGSYDVRNSPLSASKLKCLLTCKRQFYYRYIQKIKEAKMPNAPLDGEQIGTLLHKALCYAFTENKIIDEKTLIESLKSYLHEQKKDLDWRYHIDMWLGHLGAFAHNESKRYADGFRVFALEKPLYTKYRGFILEGKIDRIDSKDNKLDVIDYKSGKINLSKEKDIQDCVDFQLEFYYLLANSLGNVDALYYYDLKNGKLVAEQFFAEKLAQLESHLQSLREPIVDFLKCESTAPCKYCAYAKLCAREG